MYRYVDDSNSDLEMINCDKILEKRKDILDLEKFTLVQKLHCPETR